MSFAPPNPPDPPQPPGRPYGAPGPGMPRSTPIPGTSEPLPGNSGAAPPPTPGEFVGAPPPGMYQATPGGPFAAESRPRRSWAAIVFTVVLVVVPVIGLAVGAVALMSSSDGSETEGADDPAPAPPLSEPADTELAVPTPSAAPTPTAQPAPTPVDLFAPGGAPMVIDAFEAAISGEPSRFTQISLYPEYAFARAQDAAIPTHVDEYPWRDGVVGASSPVTLVGDGDLEATLFGATEIDWTFIARAVTEAPTLVTVEEGVVSHIIVDRSVFTDDFAVVVRVYVTGPRGGAYVEYTPAGELIDVVQ
jgi:hypothetical protein